VARSWVILGGALIALMVSLVASAVSRLRSAEGSSILSDLLGGRFGTLLLQLAFWAVVVALLVVIATALISLSREASRTKGVSGRRPAPVGPVVESPPPAERRTSPDDGRWIDLVEGCVEVIDELDQNADAFDASSRELAEHVALRLEEVLEHSGVEVIEDEASFNSARHRTVPGGSEPPAGAIISETLNPGFAVGPLVLRRARVRVERGARDASW
jgi:uncharacterized membrane protein